MIISTHALVCVSGRNKPYYESLGYVIPNEEFVSYITKIYQRIVKNEI